MRQGRTLSFYIARRLAWAIALIFLIVLILMTVIDFTQLARYVTPGRFGFEDAALAALFRGPSLTASLLPFAVLFGAIATFVTMNRRLELTVTRAAGMSAWQVLIPSTLLAVVIGLLAIALYNPGAAALREATVEMGIGGTSSISSTSGGRFWLRQSGNDGNSIIGAARTADEGTRLGDVVAIVYASDGSVRERIDAESARLVDNEWVFNDARVTRVGSQLGQPQQYRLHTNLSPAQIQESLSDPETVPFWRLPGLITIAEESSLPATGLRLRLHELLALPLLLAAMVLIAAVVSLRFSRTLSTGRLVVAGAGSGFLLYLLLEVSRDLGRGGVVPPGVAAWAPAALSALASLAILLREEDG